MRAPRLILAVIFATSLLEPVSSAELPDFPFVFAVGQAESDFPPDIAKVSFQVLAYNEDPGIALSIVHKRSGELVNLFRESGIAEADIVSYEIDKSVRQRESDNGDALETMSASAMPCFRRRIRWMFTTL